MASHWNTIEDLLPESNEQFEQQIILFSFQLPGLEEELCGLSAADDATVGEILDKYQNEVSCLSTSNNICVSIWRNIHYGPSDLCLIWNVKMWNLINAIKLKREWT